MAKKFGKLMLFSIAIGSAIGATYYYIQKKCKGQDCAEEEDYDDFSDEEEKKETSNYVPLTPEETASEESCAEGTCPEEPEKVEKTDSFTHLAEQVADTAEKAEETVEEFFDEENSQA